jgi:TnpA family transposase
LSTPDTAAYSDLIFGLFCLLGYQFSPRLADVGEARWWRIDTTADYGALNALYPILQLHNPRQSASFKALWNFVLFPNVVHLTSYD